VRPSIVVVRSWRGGTGKSTVVGRLSRTLADRGLRVGLIDVSLQAPGLHDTIGVGEDRLTGSLFDYLIGDCEIEDVHHDASHLVHPGDGRLYLIPALPDAKNIGNPAFGRYDPGLLHDGFRRLISLLKLDVLLVDTHAGINYEALYAIIAADIDIVVARGHAGERQGIRLAAAMCAQISRHRSLLVLNMVDPGADPGALRRDAAQACGVEVAAVIPFSTTPAADAAAEQAYGALADELIRATEAPEGVPASGA
jgi:MinD-like ATPase involved in chromosome partitioning or flagellar assembly